MKNFIQNGNMISITAPAGGVTSGQGVIAGNIFGIAAATAAEGESVEIATTGVYDLPKAPSAVIAFGARVSWDDTGKQVVLPDTGMYPVGTAVLAAAGNGVTTVRVRLDGVGTEAAV
jgi:predicted RecA/RadA family phage recombinase